MDANTYMYLIRMYLIFCCHQLKFSVVYGSLCREERSQRGFALLNSTYSSKTMQRYPDCIDLCLVDPKCMSFNFWWDSRKCDLNSKVREHSRSACFVKDVSSTYMGMARYPGYPGNGRFFVATKYILPFLLSMTDHAGLIWLSGFHTFNTPVYFLKYSLAV